MDVAGIAVLDIDGVVADVRHRLHHIEGRPKNWRGFFAAASADPPLPEGLTLARELAARAEIVWLTGRPEWLRTVTTSWLRENDLPGDDLRMRRSGDYRPAHVYKLQVLRGLAGRTVAAFVDDDPDVVQAARAAGFPAVLADWVPRSGDGDGYAALHEAQERLGRT